MDRTDGDYQDAVREMVQQEVGSRVNSLIREIKENVDFALGWEEQNFENYYDEESDRPPEVYEYWTVSDWLYRKLKERGEIVADFGSCYVWGRQTTGQAILLDGVICDIYDENLA